MALKPELSVFINCPFDTAFLPLFDAIAFATVCCGFMPRCSFESGTVAAPRLGRIFEAIRSSKYSIHDLSRCKGDPVLNLARFNMPLELGIAIGRGMERTGGVPDHDWLVLVPRGHTYKQFASDLAGFDPLEHDETVASILPPVISWLATRPEAVYVPSPDQVLGALPAFEARLKALRTQWNDSLPWADLVIAAIESAQTSGILKP